LRKEVRNLRVSVRDGVARTTRLDAGDAAGVTVAIREGGRAGRRARSTQRSDRIVEPAAVTVEMTTWRMQISRKLTW